MMTDSDVASIDANVVESEPQKKAKEEEDEITTSGYGTESHGIGRSDTLESVNSATHKEPENPRRDIFDDDDDDDLFKSARIEPEPRHVNGFGSESAPPPPADREINLDDDDDEEPPFKDAHLQPEFQLSGSSAPSSAASAVLGGMVASAPPATLGDRHAIFGGPTSPPPTLHQTRSQMESVDIDSHKDANDDFIEIKVMDPRKMGEGMSSFMVYKVVTKTNANFFKKKEFYVIRRFSDFLGLHQKLAEKYLQNGRIIPPAPDKSVVGTTKIKMSKDGGDNVSNDEFIERRRAALERYMNRTAAHPSLRADPDFREFLEMDADLPKSSQTSALSGKSVLKLISKVGDSISTMTLKMEETDEWFEEKSRYIHDLDEQLQKLHFSTEALAEFRKNLAISAGHVSRSLAVISENEDNEALAGAIAQLAEVQKKMEQIHNDQASADFYFLSELIKDYIGLVGAVKDAFQERIKAWQAWQSATAALTKKREAKVKAELQQKTERIQALRQEIADHERMQDLAQENFDRISRLIKKEVEFFDVRKAEDFKKSIVLYLEAMLKSQENISATWERYLPKIQQIAN